MKKITIVILLTVLSTNVFSKCDGHALLYVYNDSVLVSNFVGPNTQFPIASIAPGDWVEMKLAGDLCNSSAVVTNNSVTILSGSLPYMPYYLTLTDTGHYYIHFVSSTADWTWEFTVSYYTSTGVNTMSEVRPFLLSRSASGSIYSLQSIVRLKNLIVVDSEGRKVIGKADHFSEINLAEFPDGIYFYAITDENEKVWRGKMLKQ